jgi:thiol-disulfide isomerase/thioredoxin
MRFARVATLFAAALAMAAAPALAANLGDPAAKLDIAEWIKGEPVEMTENDKVYVVEFWATWCGPCRTSIPHLTELQEKYKDDVVFIGVSDEDAATVKPFVEEYGDKMDYRVVVDNNRTTYQNYMEAYGQNGIPTAFIVDKDLKVAWVGHPMADLDQVLEQVVGGTYDLAEYQAEMKKRDAQRTLITGMMRAAEEGETEAVHAAANEALETYPTEKDLLNAVAWMLLDHPNEKILDAELSLKIVMAAMKAEGGDQDAMVVDTYARALYDTGETEKAIEQQQKAVELAPNDEIKMQMQETLDRYKAGE